MSRESQAFNYKYVTTHLAYSDYIGLNIAKNKKRRVNAVRNALFAGLEDKPR